MSSQPHAKGTFSRNLWILSQILKTQCQQTPDINGVDTPLGISPSLMFCEAWGKRINGGLYLI